MRLRARFTVSWAMVLLAWVPALAQTTALPPPSSTGFEVPGGWLGPAWGVEVYDDEMFALSPRDPGECLALADPELVVCGTKKGLLVALATHDGSEVWSRTFPGSFRGRPVPAADGSLFVAGGDGCLHRLDPRTGVSRWEKPYCVPSPFVGEPVLLGNILVAMTMTEQVHGIDALARVPIWKFEEGLPRLLASEGTASPVAVGNDVLVGLSTGFLVRLSGDTGKPVWSVNLGTDVQGAPDVDATPVVRDGIAYTSSFGRGPVAVQVRDGTVVWRGSEYGATQALVTDTLVLVGTAEGTVVARRRSDGQPAWRARLSTSAVGSPVQVGRRVVVSGGRGLWLLDLRTGRPLDHLSMLWGIEGTPTVLGNRVFFVGNGGTIQAVDVLVP
ncbi:MAG TPA: PQQ-binding-like beta-propeller repeat protein [Myxococcota bacterium]|nr:PQQ-binding-like beta-propeller repeat protein [Myxococcota bacterium]HQK50334.1 PQQ-binding-like beta-propeller repeat protein [Myxococcota bacterium]